MPGLYRDEAVVLRTMKLGEADRIVTLFTRAHGKLRAVAKGIRKTKSRFGGRLEPFTRAQLMLYRGRDLDTVTAVDIIDSNKSVRDDYSRLTAAASLVELVEKITPDRERATSTYALLVGGLQALSEDKGTTVVPAFLVKLLSICGYHPQLSVCAGCGEEEALSAFSPPLGGALCRACWSEDESALRLPGDRIDLLRRLLGGEFGEPGDVDAAVEITDALRRYAEYHLERPLRSLQLLAFT
ncbi:MAG: DNA repair protein RecO [Actinomycetota bacterium]